MVCFQAESRSELPFAWSLEGQEHSLSLAADRLSYASHKILNQNESFPPRTPVPQVKH